MSFLEQFFSSADRQQDGFGIAAIIQTQLHGPLEVTDQQRLAYQTVGVFGRKNRVSAIIKSRANVLLSAKSVFRRRNFTA